MNEYLVESERFSGSDPEVEPYRFVASNDAEAMQAIRADVGSRHDQTTLVLHVYRLTEIGVLNEPVVLEID